MDLAVLSGLNVDGLRVFKLFKVICLGGFNLFECSRCLRVISCLSTVGGRFLSAWFVKGVFCWNSFRYSVLNFLFFRRFYGNINYWAEKTLINF